MTYTLTISSPAGTERLCVDDYNKAIELLKKNADAHVFSFPTKKWRIQLADCYGCVIAEVIPAANGLKWTVK